MARLTTDIAREFLVEMFGHEYEAYINTQLAGDFACSLMEAFQKRMHRVIVVGDGHDRIPLIDAINQIGFDGIIVAEEKQPEPIVFELPVRTQHDKIPRESNSDRCGYSTKRK